LAFLQPLRSLSSQLLILLKMALKTFVKINAVTNLSDARYCAGMAVDLLGFSLNPESSKFVHPDQFREITGWIAGPEFVAEFSSSGNPNIQTILKDYPGVSWIEFDRIEDLESLEGRGFGLIYKMDLEEVRRMEESVAEILTAAGIYFHVTSTEEHLNEDDLMAIRKLSEKCKVILGSGITPANVNDFLENLGITGIALSGGDEIKPGLKDFDELSEILEALEKED
jgi:phosphoribosylanthranilate isomerase